MEKSFNRFGSFLNFTTFVQKSLIMNRTHELNRADFDESF